MSIFTRQMILGLSKRSMTSATTGTCPTTNIINKRLSLTHNVRTITSLKSLNPSLKNTIIQTKCHTHHPQHSQHPFLQQQQHNSVRQMSGFSFAGPRKLDEIIKKELIVGKTKAEISDIWMTYHEDKEFVHGTVMNGKDGLKVLERADKLPYFIQPIFRDNGFFMLLSQFQEPNHFLLCYLEDYKMDPARAQPLLTFSIFDDLVGSHDMALLRCDVINKGISESEGFRVMDLLVGTYSTEEDHDRWVKMFNEQPESFDIDDYISCMNQKWKSGINDDDDDGGDGDDDDNNDKVSSEDSSSTSTSTGEENDNDQDEIKK